MAETIRGINVVIAGETTGLQKALADVNKQSRDIQSELRQVDRLLKLDPKNTDLLAQKKKLLADQVAVTRERLNRLREAQDQVNEAFRKGEISEGQYRAFQREIAATEQKLQQFEKRLRETGFTIEQFAKRLQDTGKKLQDIGNWFNTRVTLPVLAAGGAAYKMAADFEDAVGATEQIFGDAADAVKEWADKLPEYYGIAESEALEHANIMGTMLKNIGGLAEEEAARQAAALLELAGDLTAMYGGTTADAVRALTGALKGNNSMLDNYGIAANEALIKSKALEMGLISQGEELSLSAKQAATLAIIWEQTAAAQGQAAREAEGASGTIRDFATTIKNLAIDIGQILLPVITPFIAKLADLVRRFQGLSPETQKTIVVLAGLAAAIGPVLLILGKFASALGTILAFVGPGGTLSAALPALGGAFSALTGPVGLVIAAIAAAIAIGYALYKNWDEIIAFLRGLWERFTTWFSARWKEAGDGLKAVWESIRATFRSTINSIIKLFNRFLDFIGRLRIKVPSFNIPLIGEVGGFEIGMPKIKPIPMLAEGGIVTRPTLAMIGEAGAEAVLPLSKGRLADIIDYDALAQALARHLPGANINVTIPARDVQEMQGVRDFFARIQQVARQGV